MQVIAGGILLSHNKILVGRRTDLKFYPRVWDIIDGHMEGSETPEQTLFRELQELGEDGVWSAVGRIYPEGFA